MLPVTVASSEPYRHPAEAVLAALGSDAERGLSSAEAQRRQAAFGPNLIATAPPRGAWRQFLDQFASALVLMLVAAGAISAAIWLHERETPVPYEALAIFSIVLINAVMGYVQEARAERAAAALRQLSAAQARVIRDGAPLSIDAAGLVPGDVILVAEGDTIPADARLLRATALQTVEAALTGESVPTAKDVAALPDGAEPVDRANMVWSGTHAVYGHGRAVVTATGMQTLMGRIAGLMEKAPQEQTPLQRELERVGRMLGAVVLAIAVAVIGTILLMEGVRDLPQVLNVLILGVALAVAAVPEGLPAVVTAVLSLGMQRMARNKAIVRRLAAVETLGSATVIASDKTGTLTRNEMTVRRVVTASGSVALTGTGYAPDGALEFPDASADRSALEQEVERALIAAGRANNAILREAADGFEVHGDPTEGALIVAARKAGLDGPALDARFARLGEVPFSSERKLMSTLHRDADRPSHLVLVTKGAPDVLLAHCTGELRGIAEVPLDAARRAAILATNEALAGEALRTLGVAYRLLPAPDLADGAVTAAHERDLVFIGLIGMLDPARPEARAAVAEARAAGIRTLMMTGDHPATAAVIARELGIPVEPGVLTGARVADLDEAGLERVVEQVSVYARVDPEHKLRIVAALRRAGETVAVTGDGVNDAPALKAADIGIAMGTTGTDVSKEAADMVLADDNFATIVRAVAEGRAIFANIRKFLRYLLSSNIGEVMTMVLGLLLADRIGLSAAAEAAGGGVALPLLATQILWINLVTDGAPALALGIDPADRDVMSRPPRRRGEGVITGTMWAGIAFVGAVMAAGTLFVIDLSLPGGLVEGQGTLAYGQTMAFTTLVLFQLCNVFNARSDTASAFVRPFANRWLLIAVAGSLLLHGLVLYLPALQRAFSTVPLAAGDVVLCAVVASSVVWTRELWKIGARAIRRGRPA